MRIGIIGAMQLEIDELLSNLDNKIESVLANNKYYTGTLNGADVVITSCGVGKVNAAFCT